jgi:hypothetical protein
MLRPPPLLSPQSALTAFFDKSRTAGQFVSIIYFLLGYLPSLLLTPGTGTGARQVFHFH